MTISIGNRVKHTTKESDFGEGKVLSINYDVEPASVLVEWDKHTRKAEDNKYPDNQTHVKITSLKNIAD